MKILLTGSSGFIGSHLYKELESMGHKVVGIDNMSHPCEQEVKSQYVDVRYYTDLLPYFSNCDIVFHLAAQISVDKSIRNPTDTISTNMIGTQNILDLARKYKTKVIFASTSEIYGSSQMDYMSESHPTEPCHPYGASKLGADSLCRSYCKTFGLDVVIVRNFNIFGEHQNDDSYGGVISKFTTAALNGEPLFIFGDGQQERDYMHIKDALQAYTLAMDLPAGLVVNFGTGKTIKIIDLARKIIAYTNSKSEIKFIEPRKGEVQRLCADISYARSLGFKPETNFYQDLEGYIEWKKR